MALGAVVAPALFGALREANSNSELVFISLVLLLSTLLGLAVDRRRPQLTGQT